MWVKYHFFLGTHYCTMEIPRCAQNDGALVGGKGRDTRRLRRLVSLPILSLLPPRHSEGAIATEESPYKMTTFIYE